MFQNKPNEMFVKEVIREREASAARQAEVKRMFSQSQANEPERKPSKKSIWAVIFRRPVWVS